MYNQTLYKIVQPIKLTTVNRLNKSKKWKYGYNKEHDIVVISKTGQIGDIIEIQNFQIALPTASNESSFCIAFEPPVPVCFNLYTSLLYVL